MKGTLLVHLFTYFHFLILFIAIHCNIWKLFYWMCLRIQPTPSIVANHAVSRRHKDDFFEALNVFVEIICLCIVANTPMYERHICGRLLASTYMNCTHFCLWYYLAIVIQSLMYVILEWMPLFRSSFIAHSCSMFECSHSIIVSIDSISRLNLFWIYFQFYIPISFYTIPFAFILFTIVIQ